MLEDCLEHLNLLFLSTHELENKSDCVDEIFIPDVSSMNLALTIFLQHVTAVCGTPQWHKGMLDLRKGTTSESYNEINSHECSPYVTPSWTCKL